MRLRGLSVAVLLFAPAAAQAHPHEWVDVASEVMFDGKGRIVAIRHHWRFDEAFSAFALQGLDTDGDGAYSPEELQPLAQVNVVSLAEYSFFTFVSAGEYRAGFSKPKDYHLELDADRLTLHYTLPLSQPLFTRGQVLLQVYDPEYYIAFSLPSGEAVRLVDAPAGCRLAVFPAKGPDAAAAAALATVGADQRELPGDMQELTGGIDNSAEINCGGPTVVAAEGSRPAPQSAGEAARMMAGGTGQGFDLRALPAMAPGETAADAGRPSPSPTPAAPVPPDIAAATAAPPGLYARFMARVATLQSGFNREITASLKMLESDGSAFWWLGGISFLYGIAHAAGPGHGKVIISSYLVANEQRIRRGVLIAFLAAFVQAVVAVAIIGVMAALLDMTSVAITDTAKLFEAGSFALVAALGFYLLARKGPRALAALRGASRSPLRGGARGGGGEGGAASSKSEAARHAAAHDQAHQQEHDSIHHHHPTSRNLSPIPSPQGGGEAHLSACGHHHAAPAALEGRGFAAAAAAILSVGVRPCSGALVVLVFALAQGIFWAGVASTFLMALGTAITVAALAALAVGAKDFARWLSRGEGRRSGQLMLALELVAALFITLLGVVLFAGSISA